MTVTTGLTKEAVFERVVELEADREPLHGLRAIDLSMGWRVDGRQVTWKEVHPLLEDLAAEGRLHRCVPKRSVPYFRTIGS